MAEPADNAPDDDEPIEGEVVAEVRHLPVPATARPLAREAAERQRAIAQRPPATLPQTVAAATGGFVLGVAAFMLLKVLRRPHAARRVAGRRARNIARRRGVEIQGSQSFLVDVHLLKR